jgi:D-aminopeptidase
MTVVRNDDMSALFMAAIEATEEAIVNSLFHAETTTGRDHHRVEALPVDRVLQLMRQRGYPVRQPAGAP